MCRLDRLSELQRKSARLSAGGTDTHSREEPVCLAPNAALETWEEKEGNDRRKSSYSIPD